MSENRACSQALQWSPVTDVQVYDLLLSTTQNAKPEEMIAYWKQVLSLWLYDMLSMNGVVQIIYTLLVTSYWRFLRINCMGNPQI